MFEIAPLQFVKRGDVVNDESVALRRFLIGFPVRRRVRHAQGRKTVQDDRPLDDVLSSRMVPGQS